MNGLARCSASHWLWVVHARPLLIPTSFSGTIFEYGLIFGQAKPARYGCGNYFGKIQNTNNIEKAQLFDKNNC
ncbi:hypothetical protein BKE30_06335 [Alkanindiges hydrocarboniclasticus]|uniref:Uncharacterized protein n=1 Tax=Alkanindiges hydrocarboniclasticus TaxID=1907941 RepID=A0A1S8CWB9_9GAMM|nr:hypothetical protein [Alkanindiges hydrocarboniclasticus]ONG41039.1 hypothetical protein BKE30_06335 [Alkanindiges hydrocarboniclasticus]